MLRLSGFIFVINVLKFMKNVKIPKLKECKGVININCFLPLLLSCSKTCDVMMTNDYVSRSRSKIPNIAKTASHNCLRIGLYSLSIVWQQPAPYCFPVVNCLLHTSPSWWSFWSMTTNSIINHHQTAYVYLLCSQTT